MASIYEHDDDDDDDDGLDARELMRRGSHVSSDIPRSSDMTRRPSGTDSISPACTARPSTADDTLTLPTTAFDHQAAFVRYLQPRIAATAVGRCD